jgi:hypothetical protein
VQASQVIVWVEIISKGLEPKIRCFLEKHWVCEEWCGFLCIHCASRRCQIFHCCLCRWSHLGVQ